ncbi:hypothetical protein B0H34DRAFT_329365 [Crassisporium funariophilum]|nr:hypothetical protein B0H34DRAFT_329365 [Crassisporium funariophilum]
MTFMTADLHIIAAHLKNYCAGYLSAVYRLAVQQHFAWIYDRKYVQASVVELQSGGASNLDLILIPTLDERITRALLHEQVHNALICYLTNLTHFESRVHRRGPSKDPPLLNSRFLLMFYTRYSCAPFLPLFCSIHRCLLPYLPGARQYNRSNPSFAYADCGTVLESLWWNG